MEGGGSGGGGKTGVSSRGAVAEKPWPEPVQTRQSRCTWRPSQPSSQRTGEAASSPRKGLRASSALGTRQQIHEPIGRPAAV